jgi:hypothetical protein
LFSDQYPPKLNAQNQYWGLVGALIFSVIIFFMMIGSETLDTKNIGWLKGIDSLQHYLGWSFFRFSDWSFPVGLNPHYGLDISSSIVFSDSIPLLAFLFKLISRVLPETFQYFGLWLFVCFLLQGYFAWKLTGLAVVSKLNRFLAAAFFVISPIFIWRILGVNAAAGIGPHIALSSHFLILAALYLCLKDFKNFNLFAWTSLLIGSLLIHFYLFFMVSVLFISSLMDACFIGKKLTAGFFAAICLFILICIVFVAWQAGYFVGGEGALSAVGYGFYRMPLHALLDPAGWSRLIPSFPSNEGIYSRMGVVFSQGSYEGYAFLGIGGVIVVLTSMGIALIARPAFRSFVNRSPFFLTAFFFLTLMALTNHLGIGLKNYSVGLPQNILHILDILRNSGRLFWPVYYFILFVALKIFAKQFSANITSVAFILLIGLQIWDMHPGVSRAKEKLALDSGFSYASPLKGPFWMEAAQQYKSIVVYPLIHSQWQPHWETFSRFASEHQMGTNAVYLARVDNTRINMANEVLKKQVQLGPLNPEAIYILGSWKDMPSLSLHFDSKKDLLAKIDGYTILAPGWIDCKECQDYSAGRLKRFAPLTVKGELISFAKESGNADLFLLDSWGHAEEWGVWTTGESARIVLPLPEQGAKAIDLVFNAFVGEGHPYQEIEASLAGHHTLQRLAKRLGNKVEITIPKSVESVGYIELTIKIKKPISPRSLGIANDDRRLGVGLVSAVFR